MRLGLRARTHLAGLVPPERVPELLAGCDLLAHTSQWEGLPRAVVQALLMQVPAAGEGGVGFAFEVPVAKTEYTIEAYVPDNGNISSVSFGPITNGKVPVTGTVDDAGRAGKFVVLVDPPTSWQYLFVEVTPAPTPARTTSWGRVKVRYR